MLGDMMPGEESPPFPTAPGVLGMRRGDRSFAAAADVLAPGAGRLPPCGRAPPAPPLGTTDDFSSDEPAWEARGRWGERTRGQAPPSPKKPSRTFNLPPQPAQRPTGPHSPPVLHTTVQSTQRTLRGVVAAAAQAVSAQHAFHARPQPLQRFRLQVPQLSALREVFCDTHIHTS